MQSKRSFLPVFLICIFLGGVIFFLSRQHILPGETLLQDTFFPVQGGIFRIVRWPSGFFQINDLQKLKQENQQLQAQLVHMQQLEQDNTALRDQFQTTTISSQSLLSAEVVGDSGFFPGVSNPESLVVNKGKSDGVVLGNAVIYKTNVLGVISAITDHFALVTLVSNKITSFTAKTSMTNAQGVVSGQGNGVMVLGNVVLSDTLKVGDMVLTSGSQDLSGKGFSPGLIVGKILSVHKTPSSLYQTASVESLLDVGKLTTVFIMK